MKPISIVIRSRNEENYIGYAIQSCIDHAPKGSEIIIIDNNSSDKTLDVARLFKHDSALPPNSAYVDMSIHSISEYSPGRALNLGASFASNDIVMFLSSHCSLLSLPNDAITSIEGSTVAVFGNQKPVYMGKRLKKTYLWSHFNESEDVVDMYSDLEDRYFFHNALSLISRSALLDHPFDENLVGKEDRYWANSIINSGMHYLYKHNFSCYHYYTLHGNTWKGVG